MRFFCALVCTQESKQLKKLDKDKINKALKRDIRDGSQFDSYIDQPINSNQDLGKGDTFHTVSVMKKWTLQHYAQVSKLAQFLKLETLQLTCENIYGFLFNHIQYDIDGYLQNLRSPANSWYVARKLGIDCKSYSIFASSILLNLGIKHYIRQVKQPKMNPNNFTHVYVVVPKNQDSGNLLDGYFTIDGTRKNNSEGNFTLAKDIFMSKLPHLGLNASSEKRPLKRKKPVKRPMTKKTSTKPFFNCFICK